MEKNDRKPEIRFSGFEAAWQKKCFGDEFNILSNNTLSRDFLNYDQGIAKNVHYGDVLIKFNEYLDASKEVLPYIEDDRVIDKFQNSFLRDGDIVIADTAEDETVGKCTEIGHIRDLPIIAGLHTMPCRPKSKYAPMYLGYYLNANAYHRELLPLMQGVKVTSISRSGVKDTDIIVSEEYDEQKKIGQYLFTLDEKIIFEKDKLDRLIILKKAMLEKMFPQGNSKVPEIRFEKYTDEWEQRKVGELLIERNEQAPMSDAYPLMAFIANKGVAPKGERYDRSSLVSDAENKLYKKTEYGDFIYSSNNLETGSIGLNKYGNASLSPVYSIFQPTEIADSDFLGRRLVRRDFINEIVKWRQGVIYGQWRIHESDFIKIEIQVPKVEEQRAIGKFLDNLDNVITLHQCKVDKLKNIKSSCMDKMFV